MSASSSQSEDFSKDVVAGTGTKRPSISPLDQSLPPIPITRDGERPQKKFYRQRAHCNPLSHNDTFQYPIRPDAVDWTAEHYPNLSSAGTIVPTILDVGCGFGGLTMALAELLPSEVILGLEIRAKVTEYVRLRIAAARQHEVPQVDGTPKSSDAFLFGPYQNASVLRTNSMKFFPNYFRQASLVKLFFCFPDPHFKRKNHGRRIITTRLLSEYAFALKPAVGLLYCITDVKELHEWHVAQCNAHPLFQRLAEEDCAADPCVQAMISKTEEGQKVERNGGSKYYAVYRRILDEQAVKVTKDSFFA